MIPTIVNFGQPRMSGENAIPSSSGGEEKKETEKKHQCVCGATFSRPYKLAAHMRTHTGELPFKCTFKGCNKSYVSRQGVMRHEKSHGNSKTLFECRHCKQLISTMHNLKRHIQRKHTKHTNERSDSHTLYCPKCPKWFTKRNHYEEHLRNHEDICVILNCEYCDKPFLSLEKLIQHKFNHKKKSPCRLCQKVFDTFILRREHEKTVHKEELSCPVCKKLVYRKSCRVSHIEKCGKSQGELFRCTYKDCSKAFQFKRNLYQHERMKHEGYAYICDHCKKPLMSRRGMVRHLQNIHRFPKPRAPQPVGNRRKPRSDRGVPKKSMVTSLAGIEYDPHRDRALLMREPCID